MTHQGGGDKDALWSMLSEVGLPWRPPAADDCLLAIDDTDNLDSRGTGFRARELALELARNGLGRPLVVTRHQLLVDPRIPYTSHNSSACLLLTGVAEPRQVFECGKAYLARAAADGSDAGIVLGRVGGIDEAVRGWGRRAQREVLSKEAAYALADACRLSMAELTGEGIGVIGALAAVGLHHAGSDGRCLWVRGLREAAGRTASAAELAELGGLSVRNAAGKGQPDAGQRIELGEWPRAVFLEHRPVLLVEEAKHEDGNPAWRVVPRELIKRY